MKTKQCPSCGASASNLQNCEFCGSFFVRYSDLKITSKDLYSKVGEFNKFIFPGLEHELSRNLSLQTKKNFIVTDIKLNNTIHAQIVASYAIQDLLKSSNIEIPSLAIHVPFPEHNKIEHDKFRELEESRLFKYTHNAEIGVHDYVIDFGSDCLGASYLVSKILIEVNGIDPESELNYESSNYINEEPSDFNGGYGSINESKKGNCFIATATMGDYKHPVVIELQHFRDQYLKNKIWGIEFIDWYCRNAPILATYISKSTFLKKISLWIVIRPLLIITRIIILTK